MPRVMRDTSSWPRIPKKKKKHEDGEDNHDVEM